MERVCVTGAGGYVASWIVKLLLREGYLVHGTVREINDEKNVHLKKLEGALENLQLFKADLLDYNSLCSAISGCSGVFHVASPVPLVSVANPEVELLEPAVTGTCNVLKACFEAKVKKVVVVSSVAAVMYNPNWPKDQVMDEACWSDKEYCRATKNWYPLAKTEAESEALEYARRSGLNIVTVCPSITIGPMLQATLNTSSLFLFTFLKAGCELENNVWVVVDVRDVAEALLLTYKRPETDGRYICTSYAVRTRDLVDKLKKINPNYDYPKIFNEVDKYKNNPSSEKLQRLGWKYRPLEETLLDSVIDYQEKGILDKV